MAEEQRRAPRSSSMGCLNALAFLQPRWTGPLLKDAQTPLVESAPAADELGWRLPGGPCHAQDRRQRRAGTQRYILPAAIQTTMCGACAAAAGRRWWAHGSWGQSHTPTAGQLVEPAPLAFARG